MANIIVEMTQEEYTAARNMLDFVTWHALDGMSPAIDKPYIEDIADKVEREARYDEQLRLVNAVRKIFGLPAEEKPQI